ncbi:MAG: hypothetical protein H6730_10265 [Deltaproteobacteria bacterium]|nr:hypothetical protein [Deltaproteobacteria bacterium]
MSPDELEDDLLELVVPPEADGLRLDRALAELVPDRSRARIQKDLAADAVRLNGQPPARGAKTAVKAGDRVEYRPLPPEPLDVVPEDLPLTIVFEDQHLSSSTRRPAWWSTPPSATPAARS